MAKIVGYTDVPDVPGAAELHFDDGRKPLAIGPELAEGYRAKFGDPLANAVAGPGGGPTDYAKKDRDSFVDTVKSVGNWFTKPVDRGPGATPLGGDRPPAALAPADPVSGRPLPPGVGIAAPGEIPPSPAPAPAAAAPAPQQGPGPEQPPPGIAAGPQDPEDPIVAMGREILARKAAGGGGGGPARMAPSSEKTEITRGTPYDLQQAHERLDADAAVKDAAFSKMRAEKAAYDEQAAAAAAKIPQLQLAQATAQNEIDQRTRDYRTQRAGLEKELDDYDKSAEVDPRRFFSGDHAASAMLSVIGAGIGAAGATLGHTQNWAFEAMQKQIQQDIDAQVQAINSGHATRATALKRFVDYYHGDMEQAQTALGIAMNKAVTTEAMRFAAQSKSRDIANNAASFAALFDQNSLKREQDLYNAALGTTKTEQTSKMQGGGGGVPKLSMDDLLKYQKLAGSGKGKDQGALGLTSTGVARHKSNYANKKAAFTRFGESLADEAHALGVHIDEETGTILNKEGKPAKPSDLDVPIGVGGIEDKIPDAVVSDAAKAYRVARTNSARLHAAVVYDKSITEEEGVEEAHHRLGRNANQILDSLRQRQHELWALHRDTDAGYAAIDPRIVNQYNESQRAVNLSRATKQPLPGPRPMPGHPSGSEAEEAAEDASQ